MRVGAGWARLALARAALRQVGIVMLINVPTMSFGLAMGWVSLASGEAAAGEGEGGDAAAGRAAVLAAVTTFTATVAGVPLAARALAAGRRLAIVATSGAFAVCWALKLVSVGAGGAWGAAALAAARAAAGLGGAAAWALVPLLARELCSGRARGAAVAALTLAHNAGVLLMYLAADARLPQRLVLWGSLALSLAHVAAFLCMPESPAFLAAKGKPKEARAALARLRGLAPDDPALDRELEALPPPELAPQTPFKLVKEMLSDPRRRRAFIISGVAVAGQETCGVLAIMQYAERVFVLARDRTRQVSGAEAGAALARPSRHALLLGAAQLAASAAALYLVERVGRRPLIIWSALVTGLALAAGAALVQAGGAGAAAALAVAVAADSAGLQPAPYSLLADMFDYQYRGCALMLVSLAACAGNALEVGLFPLAAAYGGLVAALGLAAGLTLAYALFAILAVPETKGRTPEQIYDVIYPRAKDAENPDDKHGLGNEKVNADGNPKADDLGSKGGGSGDARPAAGERKQDVGVENGGVDIGETVNSVVADGRGTSGGTEGGSAQTLCTRL